MANKTLAALLGGIAAMVAVAPAEAAQRMSPEARLARALEGRVPGRPVDCINLRDVRSSSVINDTAILYRIGDTIYVNRPRAGARALNQWDTQVQRPFNNRLCSVDTVNMVNLQSGTYSGTVFLGEFVPYRRARN
jgi:hypothetical protein